MNLTYGVGGMRFVYFLWVLWWFDALVSFLCAFGMVHAMYAESFTYYFRVLL